MPVAAGEQAVAANQAHRFVKRTGTNTTISAGWTAIPFATLAQGIMIGLSTSDNITFTLGTGLWTVTARMSPVANTGVVGALFEGANVDPYNTGNSEVYSDGSSSNTGSVGAITLMAEIWVPTGTRTVRCSAFATATTLRNTGPGIPRLTFSWRY